MVSSFAPIWRIKDVLLNPSFCEIACFDTIGAMIVLKMHGSPSYRFNEPPIEKDDQELLEAVRSIRE
jgi:hypothetical protein